MADVELLSKNLRDRDVEECLAHGRTPLQSLTLGFLHSRSLYTLVSPEGEACGIIGVGDSPIPGLGAIWMLGSKDLERFPMTLVRQSKNVLEQLFNETPYDGFYNYAYSKNTLHIQWLRWLGFSLLRTVQLPPFQRDFIEFVKLRGN
jgi:hypothetical protein